MYFVNQYTGDRTLPAEDQLNEVVADAKASNLEDVAWGLHITTSRTWSSLFFLAVLPAGDALWSAPGPELLQTLPALRAT
jgi:hypothetical protein